MEPLGLTGNYKLAAAIIMGMVTGFVIMKSDLPWRDSVLTMLRLRNGRLIKTILLALALGLVGFYFGQHYGLVRTHVPPTFFWPALIGGILCGLGLVAAALTPAGALVSIAAGKFYAIWVLIGMMIALPAVKVVSGVLERTLYTWSEPLSMPEAVPELFSAGNPVLYAAGTLLALLLLVHFTVGDPEE